MVAITLIAAVASCSSDKDDDPTATIQPSQVAPTAQPTVTPVPTATNTPGPTPTPAPTATPTPTPTATPMPDPPPSQVYEMGRLFADKGFEFSTLYTASVGAYDWPTAALGCPEPGVIYDKSEAPYSGLAYVISNGEQSWEYHANADDTHVVRCSEIATASGVVKNIAAEADINQAASATLMRRDFDTNNFEVRREMTAEDAGRVADLLNQDVILNLAAPCETVFRIDFTTQSGVSEVEFICSDDYKAFDVYWNGFHGTAPALGYIVGPYLTGDPVPTLPKP
jgi:hypothetical protein